MSGHAHRASFRPFDRALRRPGRTQPAAAAPLLDRAPTVLLALSAVLVVLAGPVARAFAPRTGWVAAGSALLLALGILLALVATGRLLRSLRT